MTKPLAIVTGASSGIGLEMASLCAQGGFDLVVSADETGIQQAAERFRRLDADVIAVEADLATTDGVNELWHAIGGRDVDALVASAGRVLVGELLDQDFAEVRAVIDTNVTGTVRLVQLVGRRMRHRGHGRILLAGSVAGPLPGEYQAVSTGTRAFLDSFAGALRVELEDSGVTVTCLVPAPTDIEPFERADVARTGFEAMMRGEAKVVGRGKNGLHVAMGQTMPARGEPERRQRAERRSADERRE